MRGSFRMGLNECHPLLFFFLYWLVLEAGVALGYERLKWLLRFRIYYNVAMAFYSAFAFSRAVGILYEDNRTKTVFGILCTPSERYPKLWPESKLVGWFDTFLIIGRGRRPSRLHAFHHAITPVIVALELHAPSPAFLVGTALNAFAHTLMYLYYAFSFELRHWRAIITRVQIGQHAAMLTFLVSAMGLRDHGCAVPTDRYLLSLIFYTWLLVEFMIVFVTNQTTGAGSETGPQRPVAPSAAAADTLKAAAAAAGRTRAGAGARRRRALRAE